MSVDQLASGDLAGLPVLTKDDVLARQQAQPPFGGMLAESAAVRRVFQSPGPIYEPGSTSRIRGDGRPP